jgi:pimeloyl-ACP methyl ester carboxylesterase
MKAQHLTGSFRQTSVSSCSGHTLADHGPTTFKDRDNVAAPALHGGEAIMTMTRDNRFAEGGPAALGERRRTRNGARAVPAILAFMALWVIALPGCSSIKQVPTEHIVMIGGRGNPVDPTGNIGCAGTPPCNGSHFWLTSYPEIPRDRYDNYLSTLFDAMKRDAPLVNGKKRVLIFIHGGLNTQLGTIERAANLHQPIKDGGYYPIFINWQSSLFSSYFDHLLHIRQGQDFDWKGIPFAPFYLITDVSRSIARGPAVWWFLFWNDLMSIQFIRPESATDAARIAADVMKEGVIDLAVGEDKRDYPEMVLSGVSWFLTLPTKLVLAPVIDAFGKSAWDVMVRRTDLLFHTEEDFSTDSQVAKEAHEQRGFQHIQAYGGLSVFMRQLQEEIAHNGGVGAWDITLVGHSMGTIVLNHLVEDFGISPSGVMPFNRIVFMAGAATLKDYEDSIFPYLMKNQNAQFYHLTLHPRAEIRDRWESAPYVDLPPRGSLLVWVDDFLANPGTPHDRTVGSYTNLMVGLHNTPDELRPRIHIKAFHAGASVEETDPQHHGQFSAPFKFWKQECWEPKRPSSSACFGK